MFHTFEPRSLQPKPRVRSLEFFAKSTMHVSCERSGMLKPPKLPASTPLQARREQENWHNDIVFFDNTVVTVVRLSRICFSHNVIVVGKSTV